MKTRRSSKKDDYMDVIFNATRRAHDMYAVVSRDEALFEHTCGQSHRVTETSFVIIFLYLITTIAFVIGQASQRGSTAREGKCVGICLERG